MKMWESNGLWPLSCLAPLKEHPPIAEFQDISPEELRADAYAAIKSNQSAAYEMSYKKKLEYHKQLCESIRNRNPNAINALKLVFYKSTSNGSTPTSSSSGIFVKSSTSFLVKPSQSSIFGGSGSNNINNNNIRPSLFGGTANLTANNIFGGKTSQISMFGGTPVFGNNSSRSCVGGNTFRSTFISDQPSNIFGGNTKQNVFGPTNSETLFGNESLQQSKQLTSSSNIFITNTISNANSGTSNQNSKNVFGSETQNVVSNIFRENDQQISRFGSGSTGANSTSVFGNQKVFIKNQSTSNIFGSSNDQSNAEPSLLQNNMIKDSPSTLFRSQTSNSNTALLDNNYNINEQQQYRQPLNFTTLSSSPFGKQMEKDMSSIENKQSAFASPGINQFSTLPNNSGNSSLYNRNNLSNSIYDFQSEYIYQGNEEKSLNSTIGKSSFTHGVKTGNNETKSDIIYTPLHILSLEDRSEFEREKFLRIPIIPPPKELCF